MTCEPLCATKPLTLGVSFEPVVRDHRGHSNPSTGWERALCLHEVPLARARAFLSAPGIDRSYDQKTWAIVHRRGGDTTLAFDGRDQSDERWRRFKC